jgi:autotransporter-associated beta strand protein
MTLVGTSQSLNAASGNIVVNGAIGDGGSGLGVNLNGSAAVTLAGNNTYAGQTALISGTLVVGNTGSLGTGTLTIGGGTLDSSVANLVNANNNPEIWNTSSIYFQGTNNLDLGSGSVTVTSSPKVTVNSGTLGVGGISGSGYTLTKMGSGTLLLHGMTTLGNLFLGYNLNGGNSPTSSQGTVVIGSGGTLSIGNGSSNNLYIGWGSGNGYGGIGTLDASAAAVVNINVARVEVGATCGSYGTLILGASNTITASTDFGVNNGQWGYNNAFGTLSTAANSTTTIQTPILYVGYNIPNGTTGGSGQFLLGSGGTMNIAGIGGGRTALTIGSQGGYNGQDTFLSTMDLSAGNGIASLTLSSLIVGQDLGGNGYGQGQLILSSNAANHLDISGTGSVVLIGDNGGSSSSTGGTLTIGNLNASSAITSTDNSTAILLANARSTGSPTGVLNLGGGSLTITTAGSAIAGGGGTSVLNLGSATSGVTLIAGASSPNWIQNLTTAQINAGGVTFNPGGNSITIPQALSGSGGLTVAGAGILNLSGSNSYLGGTHVSGGTLQVGNYNALGSGGLTANAGVVDLAGISPAALSSFSGSSGLITNSGPSSTTLYVGQSSATTFSGTFQDGASSVGLTLNSGTLTLLGSNTQSGATTVNLGASLIAGAANTLSPNSAVTINGGLLDVTAGSQSIAGLTIYSGALNLHVGNLLTSTAYSSLGGVLNVYETTPGTAELISFPNSYSGTFTPGSLPSGYALSYGNANQVDLVLASANSSAWTSSLGGSWTGSSNWTSGVPSGQAFTALLGGALAASGTVTLDGPQTLGTLIFSNSAASYALTAGNSGSLTLDNTGGSGGSQIIVLAGTHSITAPLTIANGPALISLINSGSLDISGDVSEAGGSHSLSLSSSDATGVLSLDGSNSFTGGVYVNSGTLILNGASALAPGSTLVIGTTSPPSLPTVISSPVAVPTANLAPVPEPGTRSLFMVCAAALGFSYLLRNSLKTTDF